MASFLPHVIAFVDHFRVSLNDRMGVSIICQ
jgi:hypothetical protein